MGMKDPATFIEATVRTFLASPENNIGNGTDEPAWADPLIGYSNGADPLYAFYKRDIGDFYKLPIDFFRHSYPKTAVRAEELVIVSWILPQTEATKRDQREETSWPSERWARTRIHGEEVNDRLRAHLVKVFNENDIEAVAPQLSDLWLSRRSDTYGHASTWSERHAAYAAGLGTFGLSDGLITSKGKAHRCGSVIARTAVSPSTRPYTDRHAYCLFYAKGVCGTCIGRCPVGAISFNGHDKEKCSTYVNSSHSYVETHYGFKGYGCGLCQTGVPCESGIPSGITPK
jgi:epoxyqueuosine reductase QueG